MYYLSWKSFLLENLYKVVVLQKKFTCITKLKFTSHNFIFKISKQGLKRFLDCQESKT